ncbi:MULTISPECIES: hypothetical protein [Paracoccus]|uniref:Argininosuccinate lyase n=1 Tax=Paracoccus versutus TaxID=34007 RepID=A0A3D9XHJ0_PARVE|nr:MULTISPECIES: hypothetical protein [Paracoccus]MBT0779004.1 hypothetical protein [Paracoccus sp. pheM1]REF68543.1 hypothetical protein BDD41_3605 [Paracoccus versutus]
MTQHLLLAAFALILATLAACGVDGAPTRPEPAREAIREPGVHISGEARFGVIKQL